MSLQDGTPPTAPAQSTPPPTSSGSAARDEIKEFILRNLERHGGHLEDALRTDGRRVPPDSHVYLDRSFFEALAQRFGAPGEFARAYVIAHEIGHHVQKQLGITEKVGQQRARAGKTRSNAVSVRIELQADCFAGIWGHFAR